MKILLFLIFFACGAPLISARVQGIPEPTPQSASDKAIRRQNDISRRSNELRNVENFPVRTEKERRFVRDKIQPLYRKPTDSEMENLALIPEDVAKYSAFARRKKSGVVKLVADIGCADNDGVLSASKACAKYTMPGAGSAFSFRVRMHRLIRLADINFKKNSILALGTLTHGVLVDLGDVAIEDVDLKSNGGEFIAKFKSAKTIEKAAELANKLKKGIKEDGFLYASILAAKPNSTYLLRSIAYRGEALKTIGPFVYNELDFDKRRDVIIAFRVVRMETGKSITIIWRELRNKKSPRIKIKK